MPYILAFPETLIMYRTIKQARQAAEDRLNERVDNECSRLDVEIYRVQYVIAIEPPPPNGSDPGMDRPDEEVA